MLAENNIKDFHYWAKIFFVLNSAFDDRKILEGSLEIKTTMATMTGGLELTSLLIHRSQLSFLMLKCSYLLYYSCFSRRQFLFFFRFRLVTCKDCCFFCSMLSVWSYDHLYIFLIPLIKMVISWSSSISYSCICLFLPRL